MVPQTFEDYYTKNEKIVWYTLNRYFPGIMHPTYSGKGYDREDFEQLAKVAMWKGYNGYVPTHGKGASINTFVIKCIRNEIGMALHKAKRWRRESITFVTVDEAYDEQIAPTGDIDDSAFAKYENVESQDIVDKLYVTFWTNLSERQREVMTAIQDNPEQKHHEVAARFGLSRAAVSKIRLNVITKWQKLCETHNY